ncbi:MAG TPA: DUF4249 domain-containing protein [Bacteroidales bacterium]|nr:DUF4249 domain-containing protein [Bacteroidales bacterium]
MIRKIFPVFLLALLATACTEKTQVHLDSTYARLVVDGHISSDTGNYSVALTRSAEYFYNEPAPRVTGATVTVSDAGGTLTLHETEPGVSGIYETGPGYAGVKGNSYTLNISLKEEIGGSREYQATSALHPVAPIDSIRAEFHPDWGKKGIWTIKLWAQEPGDEVNYYLFNLYRNGKLLTDTITKKVVADDRFVNGSYMNGFDVMYLMHYQSWATIYPGDTITLQMSGITKEYYDFINQVDQSGFSIPFFSGPPANVKGNISNGGIGFFAAWSDSWCTAIVKGNR